MFERNLEYFSIGNITASTSATSAVSNDHTTSTLGTLVKFHVTVINHPPKNVRDNGFEGWTFNAKRKAVNLERPLLLAVFIVTLTLSESLDAVTISPASRSE